MGENRASKLLLIARPFTAFRMIRKQLYLHNASLPCTISFCFRCIFLLFGKIVPETAKSIPSVAFDML